MASIVVCGGSVIGLTTAMLLARDGHRITVLERDAAPPPESPERAWGGWDRPGVAQLHQPHTLFPPFRLILEEASPGAVERLVAAGCAWVDPLATLPPTLVDKTPRPGDDRFRFVTGRRPVVDCVVAQAAAEADGVVVRRGVAVAGLLTGADVVEGVPNVTGVRTTTGEELAADLVVDASGRRSRLVDWLGTVGAHPPEVETEDFGFVYHTRYFRGPRLPRLFSAPVTEIGTISVLTIPGDNGTWSVTVWTAAADTALRRLRDADGFTAVVKACRLHAHWVKGEPISDVLTMAGVLDRHRRFVVDDRPVATGVVAVGDAWACTNPAAGRGVSVGMIHAGCLRDVVRSHPGINGTGDAETLVREFDRVTADRVAPFYWNQIAADRARMVEIDALLAGHAPPPPDPTRAAMGAAVVHDPDVFRGMVETALCLALPEDVFARPGFMDRVRAADGLPPPPPAPGPDRAALLRLLA